MRALVIQFDQEKPVLGDTRSRLAETKQAVASSNINLLAYATAADPFGFDIIKFCGFGFLPIYVSPQFVDNKDMSVWNI